MLIIPSGAMAAPSVASGLPMSEPAIARVGTGRRAKPNDCGVAVTGLRKRGPKRAYFIVFPCATQYRLEQKRTNRGNDINSKEIAMLFFYLPLIIFEAMLNPPQHKSGTAE